MVFSMGGGLGGAGEEVMEMERRKCKGRELKDEQYEQQDYLTIGGFC